jgi:hypothetical protein
MIFEFHTGLVTDLEIRANGQSGKIVNNPTERRTKNLEVVQAEKQSQ